jgi:hypothetical protein
MSGDEVIPNLSREAEEKIIKAMASAMAESDGHHGSSLSERLELETVARRQYLAHKAMLNAIRQHVAQESERSS